MPKFKLGDPVRKTKGSCWSGKVVGTYSTELTPEGYAVESFVEKGSVQIYPAAALEKINVSTKKPKGKSRLMRRWEVYILPNNQPQIILGSYYAPNAKLAQIAASIDLEVEIDDCWGAREI